jgi:hypothetical protein
MSLPSDEFDLLFANLFLQFRKLYRPTNTSSSKLPQDSVKKFFEGFDIRWQSYGEACAFEPPSLSIWKVAALGLEEVRNCRVLKCFSSPTNPISRARDFSGAVVTGRSTRWTGRIFRSIMFKTPVWAPGSK